MPPNLPLISPVLFRLKTLRLSEARALKRRLNAIYFGVALSFLKKNGENFRVRS